MKTKKGLKQAIMLTLAESAEINENHIKLLRDELNKDLKKSELQELYNMVKEDKEGRELSFNTDRSLIDQE